MYLEKRYTPRPEELMGCIDRLTASDVYGHRELIGRLLTLAWKRQNEIGADEIRTRMHQAGEAKPRETIAESVPLPTEPTVAGLRVRLVPKFSLPPPPADKPRAKPIQLIVL